MAVTYALDKPKYSEIDNKTFVKQQEHQAGFGSPDHVEILVDKFTNNSSVTKDLPLQEKYREAKVNIGTGKPFTVNLAMDPSITSNKSLTKMHAINSYLHSDANKNAENLFLGSAAANKKHSTWEEKAKGQRSFLGVGANFRAHLLDENYEIQGADVQVKQKGKGRQSASKDVVNIYSQKVDSMLDRIGKKMGGKGKNIYYQIDEDEFIENMLIFQARTEVKYYDSTVIEDQIESYKKIAQRFTQINTELKDAADTLSYQAAKEFEFDWRTLVPKIDKNSKKRVKDLRVREKAEDEEESGTISSLPPRILMSEG